MTEQYTYQQSVYNACSISCVLSLIGRIELKYAALTLFCSLCHFTV